MSNMNRLILRSEEDRQIKHSTAFPMSKTIASRHFSSAFICGAVSAFMLGLAIWNRLDSPNANQPGITIELGYLHAVTMLAILLHRKWWGYAGLLFLGLNFGLSIFTVTSRSWLLGYPSIVLSMGGEWLVLLIGIGAALNQIRKGRRSAAGPPTAQGREGSVTSG